MNVELCGYKYAKRTRAAEIIKRLLGLNEGIVQAKHLFALLCPALLTAAK